jgi:hypothetical protein
MARRLLGLIGSDPSYWKSRFFSMVEPRQREHEVSVVTGIASDRLDARPRESGRRSPRKISEEE